MINTFFSDIFFTRKNAWIKKLAKKFFIAQVVRKKLSQKIVHRFFDEKFFCMNNLFSLLHDASLKAAVFSGCTFWRFHIFRFWNYPIKGNLHFTLKKMWQHHAKKRQTNLPCRNCSIGSGGCSISNLPCKDIKYLTECQVVWQVLLTYNPNKPVHRR